LAFADSMAAEAADALALATPIREFALLALADDWATCACACASAARACASCAAKVLGSRRASTCPFFTLLLKSTSIEAIVPETCVPTEIRLRGLTVPDAVTEATSVCCVTATVCGGGAERARSASPATSASTNNRALAAQTQPGSLPQRDPSPASPLEFGNVMVDIAS